MTEYIVHFRDTVEAEVTVTADDEDEAIAKARHLLPSEACNFCAGQDKDHWLAYGSGWEPRYHRPVEAIDCE